jgi:hypothetical protein
LSPDIRLTVGGRVQIRREWCDTDEEHDMLYLVVEDRGDRVLIAPEHWPFPILPEECVSKVMIEPRTNGVK